MKYKQISIGRDKLRDSVIYNVRVRAKPVGYFDGNWTEWSTVKSFKVKGKGPLRVNTCTLLQSVAGKSSSLILSGLLFQSRISNIAKEACYH